MRHNKRVLVTLLCLVSTSAFAATQPVASYFGIRSQSRNAARKVAGTVGLDYRRDMMDWYWYNSDAVAYNRSFRSERMAVCLFGDKVDKCKDIDIQGSNVGDRKPNALLADYFYLPTDFESIVSICPKITNFLVDFNFYMGLDKCFKNWYFRAYAPLVRTSWDLELCESVCKSGENPHAEGYFTPRVMPREQLLNSFCEYLAGASPMDFNDVIIGDDFTNLNDDDTAEIITMKFHGLRFARMCKSSQKETRLADLRAELGYNFLNKEDYHVGFNFQTAAPTGNRPKAGFLFEPIVGNGKHWEFGGGITGHYILWRGDMPDTHLGIYLDANLTHMFETRQRRTFDLVGKPLSRYMLAEKIGLPIIGGLVAGSAASFKAPSAQFKYEYTPVANLTTMDVDVRVGIQADIALWLNYTKQDWSLDLGYNFWGRSCEHIKCPDNCVSDPCCVLTNLCTPGEGKKWALKGDSYVFGFNDEDRATVVPLSATQSLATVCTGLNVGDNTNPEVDNATPAFKDDGTPTPLTNQRVVDATQSQTNTSLDPVFLSCDDIDLCTTTRGISHKLWAHLNYSWEKECGDLFLGVGAEAEFGKDEGSVCDKDCTVDSCLDCAVSQWGFWIKGGIAFE